jgi:hypothetical protein
VSLNWSVPVVSQTCHHRGVDLTGADFDAIPARNIHVPRVQFAAVWLVAERTADTCEDWYAAGVSTTCRWLARATVRPKSGRWYLQWAPITERQDCAYEELIEAECLAAERALFVSPPHVWLSTRPGWIQGIVATLNWAWRRSAPAPLDTSDVLPRRAPASRTQAAG